MALLLREAIGDSLRRTRVSQSRTLREVSNSARVSLGYLSEVERGRKEASSELLAAICDALEVPLSDVLVDVSESLSDGSSAKRGNTERHAAESAPADVPAASARPGSTTIARDTRVVIPAPAQALAAA
ncbi:MULTISPECIES: helix-turn-helix domain-containing protein [unclassified Rhodococcus (in: high G+C Gram-positive bacteria)]|uniref:helix-turn-helix domain-containing protein n=1 Tax=unclassified Rhodococcus (in: high G+C Gram-positive bacteria) TaxID=192944 RepID=UPI00163B3ACA|nr:MULTISPECIES: helix-turn-helix transcriptional regulator [unclassified Rhodococcus (in: high G+C Gram-positive bacteria)]MBC2643865.1 helix-turn-helix transcriptional regulator [Rhodococcus sp. 3A]MBC2891394.1 helix-turn-helix transcriptional regulator [Rhodococcus sp. 4CII]